MINHISSITNFSDENIGINALELLKQPSVLNVSKTLHEPRAEDYNNMAGLYRTQGLYDKMIEAYEKALEIRESSLGLMHLKTATVTIN